MTATQRGSIRNTFDDYPTPRWAVRRLLEYCRLPGGLWLEPAAGFGNLMLGVNEVRPDVSWVATEIQGRNRDRIHQNTGLPYEAIHTTDFRTIPTEWLSQHFQVLITNPPFDLAFDFAQKGVASGVITVLLLRLAWLSGNERVGWLRAHTPDVYVLPNRPKFLVGDSEWGIDKKTGKPKKKGGDASDYGWLVWYPGERQEGKVVILNRTPLAERQHDHRELRRLAA